LMLSTLRTNPENAKAHNHAGIVHGKNKDYANAMKEFQIAMQLDPNLAETYHNMGNAFDEQGKALLQTDPQKADEYFNNAIPLYEKAVELQPSHWMSYQNIANIYFDRKDYAKTAEYIEKIIPINPNLALFSNLGIVYLKLGDKDKAKEAFQIVLQNDPQNGLAQQGLAEAEGKVPPQLGLDQPLGDTAPENPAMPGGALPPEVLKAIQEQTQKAGSSAPSNR
jgi:tetratricopeptide (TPR) repeat protein